MTERWWLAIVVALAVGTSCGGDEPTDATDPPPTNATTVPDTTAPDTSAPDTTAPDTTVPDTTGPDPGTTDAHPVAGTIVGQPPADATIALLWPVWASSPDRSFLHGSLEIDGDRFSGAVRRPPTEALNDGVLGVALLLVVPDDVDLPGGELSAEFEAPLLGGGERHVVIYVDREAPAATRYEGTWVDGFGDGFSCGDVVPNPQDFDTFVPADCAQLEITTTDDPSFPNFF